MASHACFKRHFTACIDLSAAFSTTHSMPINAPKGTEAHVSPGEKCTFLRCGQHAQGRTRGQSHSGIQLKFSAAWCRPACRSRQRGRSTADRSTSRPARPTWAAPTHAAASMIVQRRQAVLVAATSAPRLGTRRAASSGKINDAMVHATRTEVQDGRAEVAQDATMTCMATVR